MYVEVSHFKIIMSIISNTFLFFTFFSQQTPLHVAASKGRDYTVECLVNKGANKDTKDKKGVRNYTLIVVGLCLST